MIEPEQISFKKVAVAEKQITEESTTSVDDVHVESQAEQAVLYKKISC